MVCRSRLSKILGATVACALMAAAVSAETLSGATPRRPQRRLQPVRHGSVPAVALRALASCEATADYLADAAVEMVLSYRYNWYLILGAGGAEDGPGGGPPDDYTTTNNQEQGVDELDIVKTDGTHLYTTEGDALHVLGSWPPETTSELATFTAPVSTLGLFLHDHLVLVASILWHSEEGFGRSSSVTRLEVLDVSDPENPAVVRTVDVEGWLVDARLIGGQVYAVLRSSVELPDALWSLAWRDDLGLPELPWDAGEEERERILGEARSILAPLVREILSQFGSNELLPKVRDRKPGDPEAVARPLLDCSSLYRPAELSSLAVLSVLHLDLAGGPVSATGLLADGWTVYASATNLYVAQTSDWWWWWQWQPRDLTTTIHKFELDPSSTEPVRYAASGSADGWILDQFALSEHEGHLRVATTEFDWWWNSTPDDEPASSVTVFEDDGRGTLRVVGGVGGLGPGERIFAVRFMGEVGYVVTFEQVDPLYTLDLSDPVRPTVVGSLEVTGFSSYLHPMGDGWLLAVGMEADEEGRVLGLAVSVFDVRDPAEPKLAHRHLIEGEAESWSWSEALSDHHAFTFHRGVLTIPAYVDGPEGRFNGLIVFSVDPARGISELGRIDHNDLAGAEYGPWMRRSVFIEDAVYSLSSAGVKVNDLHHPEVEYARVPFKD